MNNSTKGAISAAGAFALWGVLPVFWKLLYGVNLLEVTAHRVIWTLVILVAAMILRNNWKEILTTLKSPKVLFIHALAGLVLAANWLLYVWATHNDRILEGALGYYINPFLYILLGRIIFKEQHSRIQLLAIAIAASGVALQFPAIKIIPWVAITLAVSFTTYGMLRKQSPLGSFAGLSIEMAVLLPVALGWLTWQTQHESTVFGPDLYTNWLLIGAGVATAAPFLLFAYGARNIELSLLGVLQFIGPTGQFLVGYLIYHEPMPWLRLVSFSLIWAAVLLYALSLRPRKQAISS